MKCPSNKSRDRLMWLNHMCHYFKMLIILILYTMCISVVRCNADADSNPEPKADPDPLWDKLPALQNFQADANAPTSNPLQSFTSIRKVPRDPQSFKTSRNVDKHGFSMKNIFPLSLVPKPIASMQNMFAFSKSKPNHSSSRIPLQKATNKTIWRQLDNNPESKPMKPNLHYGAKSNGFSRLLTFDEKKKHVLPKSIFNIQNQKPTRKFSPSSKSNQQEIEPIKRDNHFRSSAVALFGGNADYGWKRVVKPKTTPKTKSKFSLEETIQRQAHLNSVINMYKNTSLTLRHPGKRKSLVDNFSQNMKLEYDNHNTKMDADDAILRSKNSDHRKPFNHLISSKMVSNYNSRVMKPFQGQKSNPSYPTDVEKNINRNNRLKDTSSINGRKMGNFKNKSSLQQNSLRQSMSSSMPIPTVKTKLNRRIGSFPSQQSLQSRMGDDDISAGVDGGLLGLGNQLNSDLGNRLLASKKAVNVLSKVREMQDEIKELNRQIEEENLKFKMNNAMQKKELEEEMKETTTALLNKDVTPTAKVEIVNQMKRDKILSTLSDSKKSIIEMLTKSESVPASNLGDALKLLLEKRQQRQKNEQQKENEKQQELLEQREEDQRLRQEKQKQKELLFLKNQKDLLSSQQSLLTERPLQDIRTDFQKEREKLITEINKVKKKRTKGRGRKLRKLLLQRFKSGDNKEIAQKAHLRLALSSNKRIINKIERLKNERRKSAALRQKQMIDKQLNELNALRILQRKRLQNLRKKNNQGRLTSSKQSAALLQQRLKQKLPPSSPILRLTTGERQKLLTFMDFERNSEILKSTNAKIRAKAQKQRLKQDATKQTLKVLEEFNEYDDYDLSDAEIDEILLGFLGGEDTFDFDYAYEDYFGDDELDLYDVLYDDYEDECPPALCRPLVPVAPRPRPIPRPHIPPYHPPAHHTPEYPSPTKYPIYEPIPVKPTEYYPPRPQPSYKPHHKHVHHTTSSYYPSTYESEYGYHPPPKVHHTPHGYPKRPKEITAIHGENPSSFPPKHSVVQHHPPPYHPPTHFEPDYDYYDYEPGHQSGPEFLDEVSGIIGGSEAVGLPPRVTNNILKDSVLHNIQHKIRSELSDGPPNHFRSHVEYGFVPHGIAKSVLPPQPPVFGRKRNRKHRKKHRPRRPHLPFSSSNHKENIASEKASKKVVKAVKSIKGDPDSVSFSEIMADFLTRNPLPFKDKNKETMKSVRKGKTKPKSNKSVFVPFKRK